MLWTRPLVSVTAAEVIRQLRTVEAEILADGIHVGTYCADNGSEFTSQEFAAFLTEADRTSRPANLILSSPHDQHQNARVESAWHRCRMKATTNLLQAGAPHTLWWQAFAHGAHTSNLIPSVYSANPKASPKEQWWTYVLRQQAKTTNDDPTCVTDFPASAPGPSIAQTVTTRLSRARDALRCWGCPAFVWCPPTSKGMLPRAREGQFIGYSANHTLGCYDIRMSDTNCVMQSMHCAFDESAVIKSSHKPTDASLTNAAALALLKDLTRSWPTDKPSAPPAAEKVGVPSPHVLLHNVSPLAVGSATPKAGHIRDRIAVVAGLPAAAAVGTQILDRNGKTVRYTGSDLRYDLARRFLVVSDPAAIGSTAAPASTPPVAPPPPVQPCPAPAPVAPPPPVQPCPAPSQPTITSSASTATVSGPPRPTMPTPAMAPFPLPTPTPTAPESPPSQPTPAPSFHLSHDDIAQVSAFTRRSAACSAATAATQGTATPACTDVDPAHVELHVTELDGTNVVYAFVPAAHLQDINRHFAAAATISSIEDPNDPHDPTYAQAMASPARLKWIQAITDEFASLAKMHTWRLVVLPRGARALGTTLVLKRKFHADGSYSKEKARICIQGFSQRKGVDFEELFSPVSAQSAFRLCLISANHLGSCIKSFDFKTAFLNSKMDRVMYAKQHKSQQTVFDPISGRPMAYLVEGSLYGARQSPRLWFLNIDTWLQAYGFKPGTDRCLYVKGELRLLLYVDDVCATYPPELQAEYDTFLTDLRKTYDFTDFGDAKEMLGVEIDRNLDAGTITLTQTGYNEDLLARSKIDGFEPRRTPADASVIPGERFCPGNDPSRAAEKAKMATLPFRHRTGGLLWSARTTRPCYAYIVGMLARVMHDPGFLHWAVSTQALQYLKHTRDRGITYTRHDGPLRLHGYVDADYLPNYGTAASNRRSTTGWVMFAGGAAVTWRSKRQDRVAASTAEAEWMAAFDAAREVSYLRFLCADFGCPQDGPTILYEDNQACIRISESVCTSQRTKHVDARYHMLRERVLAGELRLVYCNTKHMVADTLTKSLPPQQFEYFSDCMLGRCPAPQPEPPQQTPPSTSNSVSDTPCACLECRTTRAASSPHHSTAPGAPVTAPLAATTTPTAPRPATPRPTPPATAAAHYAALGKAQTSIFLAVSGLLPPTPKPSPL